MAAMGGRFKKEDAVSRGEVGWPQVRACYVPAFVGMTRRENLSEVVGVSLELEALRRRPVNHRIDAVLFRIGDRGFPAREVQGELTAGIAAAGPAHQRVGPC